MQIINMGLVSIPTTAGGTDLITSDQARAATSQGMYCVGITPSVDIVLVDNQGIAAAVPGTAANSPWTCPAGVTTTVGHTSGALRAISTSGTASVKVSIGCAP